MASQLTVKSDKDYIPIVPKLVSVFEGEADYRCAHGGRGSGKTRSFATMAALKAAEMAASGTRGVIVCARENQNSLAQSSFAEVREAILRTPALMNRFDIGTTYIKTRDGRVEFLFFGTRHNVDTIKSTAYIRLVWVDEAEHVPSYAWDIITGTIREEKAECWVTWNPESERSATDNRFRQRKTDRMRVAEVNFNDNPWFSDRLERERAEDEQLRPEIYAHKWLGAYAPAERGAYYHTSLAKASKDGRIGVVDADPLMRLRVYIDIGGTGAKSDAFVMWVVQFVGPQIRVLDYYEAVGQPATEHIGWIRGKKYDAAEFVFPHDGNKHDFVERVTYSGTFRTAGLDSRTLPNQGIGAAKQRVEAVRRALPNCWFNKKTTDPGVSALEHYHEKWDDRRNIGLGAEHDWSSHAADAFGYMSIDYLSRDKTVANVDKLMNYEAAY